MGKYLLFYIHIFKNITEMQSLLTWSNAFSLSPTSLHEIQLKPAELQSPFSHQCPTISAEKCRIFGGAWPLWQLSFPTSLILFLPSEVGVLCRIEFLLLRLRILDLSNNYLTELPDEIGNLSEIVQLQLGNNQLSTISPALGLMQHLEVLKFMECIPVFKTCPFSDFGPQQQSALFTPGRNPVSPSSPPQSQSELLPPWKSSRRLGLLQLAHLTRGSRQLPWPPPQLHG